MFFVFSSWMATMLSKARCAHVGTRVNCSRGFVLLKASSEAPPKGYLLLVPRFHFFKMPNVP
uniref:Secreted protein n=1 Tax=Rhizophora mucronata TaxID=61149 RepID=A0A2P2NIT6_RHIMU